MDIKHDFSYPGDDWMRRLYGDFMARFGNMNLLISLYLLVGAMFLGLGLAVNVGYLVGCIYFFAFAAWWIVNKIRKKGRGGNRLFKIMKDSPVFGLSGTKEINDDGIGIMMERGNVVRLSWGGISDSIEGDDYFYFVKGKLLLAFLNKKDMSPEQTEELRQWLIDHKKWGKGASCRLESRV